MKLLHNKKSNLGLIFEFLLQEFVEATVKKDAIKRKSVLNIVKKYFFENKYIKEEFNIVTALLNADYKDKDSARFFLVECLKEVEKLKDNLEKTKLAKQQLLEEIYKTLDKKTFFEHTINNYKVYATTNLIVDYYNKNKKKNDFSVLISLEKNLLEHITNNKIKQYNKESLSVLISEAKVSDDNTQMASIAKYREFYFDKLNANQQELLEYYMLCKSEDLISNKIDKHYRTNLNELKNMYMRECVDFTKQKLKEVIQLFENNYKKCNTVENKLKIVLDSFVLFN